MNYKMQVTIIIITIIVMTIFSIIKVCWTLRRSEYKLRLSAGYRGKTQGWINSYNAISGWKLNVGETNYTPGKHRYRKTC